MSFPERLPGRRGQLVTTVAATTSPRRVFSSDGDEAPGGGGDRRGRPPVARPPAAPAALAPTLGHPPAHRSAADRGGRAAGGGKRDRHAPINATAVKSRATRAVTAERQRERRADTDDQNWTTIGFPGDEEAPYASVRNRRWTRPRQTSATCLIVRRIAAAETEHLRRFRVRRFPQKSAAYNCNC